MNEPPLDTGLSSAFPGYRDPQVAGEGGLGRVYRAVRISTGGVVAIKELREVPSASPAWHRAQRELDAMLRLKGHPFVVSVEEIFYGPQGPCIVMEYLDGGSLMDRLRHGQMAVPEFVLAGEQISSALAAAHQSGIVHRDVKPHNILVSSFGQMKVADFGISALTRDADLRTRTQAFTLAYASPEELDGDMEVGAPADAYSFAATMFHLATARKPSFRDRTVIGEWHEIASRHPAMGPVVAALRQSLEIEPDRRPSMEQLHRVFGVAASQLGERRISRLHAPGTITDPPLSEEFVHVDSVATHRVGPPPQVPPPATPGHARSGRWFATGIAVTIVCVTALVLVLGRTGIDEGESGSARLAAAPTETPAITSPPIVPATSAAPDSVPATAAVTVAATVPATTGPVVVSVAPPPPVTGAPLITETAATTFFDEYLATSLAGLLEDGWAMLSPGYQAKYRGFTGYSNFWATVFDAGIRRCSSIGSTSTMQTLRCFVFYGRVRDGAILNEIIEVDVTIDPATGTSLITDYRYISEG